MFRGGARCGSLFIDDSLDSVCVPLNYLSFFNHLYYLLFWATRNSVERILDKLSIFRVHKIRDLVQWHLLYLVFDCVWVEFELIQEHVTLDFTRHTLNSDLSELLQSHDRRIIVIPVLKLNSIIIMHVELEPSWPKQINTHWLFLEAKGV